MKAKWATRALQATGAKLVPKAPSAPKGLKARLDPPAKPDFLVFTAEMAILRVLRVMLESRAPKAPSEHEVLPEPLDNKVPQVPQDKLGLWATPAQPESVVLKATWVQLDHKVIKALKALAAKLENKATWVKLAHKVTLAHKVPSATMVQLVLAATLAPQAPLVVKVPSALLVWMATRAKQAKQAPRVLSVRRVSAVLSVQPA